jgi:hypothetical protein
MQGISPEHFFDQELPALFEQRAARPERQADIIFEIVGGGGGRWLVRLAQPPRVEPVDPWFQGQLVVRMEEELFGDFIAGTLDVVTAVDEGRLFIAGDATLLDELAAMWREPLNPLSVRARGDD